MTTRVDEIADGIFRLSTFVPDIGPTGFTFNQYLVRDDEPLLFHTGMRRAFPSVSQAISSLIPLDRLRWITFGHIEADECGSLNDLLEVAPDAQVAHGVIGCGSLADMIDRPPVPLADGEVIEIGSHRLRHLDTPHVPHNWEARVLFEESTGTLLCGDLFAHLGDGPPITGGDIVGPAAEAEEMFNASGLTPSTGATMRRLAELEPSTLALMHGSCFSGDGARALHDLADVYDGRLRDALG